MKKPLPLLVPVNTNGTFSCKALCVGSCIASWIIDGEQHGGVVNEHGMRSQFDHSNDNEYTLTLTVNVSEEMNNTSIKCRYELYQRGRIHIIDSDTVYLYVISSEEIISSVHLDISHLKDATM